MLKVNSLQINHVSKCFGDVLVLDDISFVVEKSKIVGLASPSGGGKSTLLRCIQKLEAIDSGSIECNGETGFMFQDFQLFAHMSVLQNVLYAPNLHDKIKGNLANNNKRVALEMLDNLGILDKAQECPNKLSGGQKQRVALARSLMMHPEILLCDEPTSGLDVATILDIVSLLKSVRDMGVTMVIASHDLDFLTKIADRVIVLRSGKIVADIEPVAVDDPIFYLKKYYTIF